MLFRDLYKLIVEEVQVPPVRFERLRHLINLHHAGVGEINVRAIQYPEPNHQAHYVLLDVDRTSPYEDEFIIAEIRYCDALDNHRRDRRFALTKELMHVFDNNAEMTDTREKFIELLREIQNQPLAEHASEMYKSELSTKWMALIILCPAHIRALYLDKYWNKQIEGFEIAEKLNLPEWVIQYIMDDYYEKALEALLNKQ